ncbi:hypothetical protein [Nonomuraea sp. NPDC002799]
MDDVRPKGEMLYSWQANESRDRGAGGVARSGNLAAADLLKALAGFSPGASGSVVRVALDRQAREPSYLHGPVLLRVRRCATNGVIVAGGGG